MFVFFSPRKKLLLPPLLPKRNPIKDNFKHSLETTQVNWEERRGRGWSYLEIWKRRVQKELRLMGRISFFS